MHLPEVSSIDSAILFVNEALPEHRQLTKLLQQRGCMAHAATGIHEAMSHIENTEPDLIVFDIDTLGVNAYDICIRIKATPKTRDIPIIFLGSSGGIAERNKVFASGGSDYISKPVIDHELHTRIATHLALRNLRRKLEQPENKRISPTPEGQPRSVKKCIELQRDIEALRERNALLQCMVDSSTIGIVFWHLNGRLIEANGALLQMLELKQEDVLSGRVNLLQLCVPEERLAMAHDLAAVVSGKRFPPSERQALRSDGNIIPILIGCACLDLDEALGVSFVFDLSKQKNMERKLLESRKQLRDLAAHSERAMEMERKRIAREVHDELGSQLMALKMNLDLLRRELDGPKENVQQRLDSMEHILSKAVRVMRQIATELRPAVLNMGFLASLEWLADSFRKYSNIPCCIKACGEVPLDDVRATALFRIVQESLINIARHAQASRVDIELSLNDKKIELRIADNGQGFEPKKVGSQSFGLLGMVERLEVFGGKLVIDSARGRGTNLRITLPLGEPTCSAS